MLTKTEFEIMKNAPYFAKFATHHAGETAYYSGKRTESGSNAAVYSIEGLRKQHELDLKLVAIVNILRGDTTSSRAIEREFIIDFSEMSEHAGKEALADYLTELNYRNGAQK